MTEAFFSGDAVGVSRYLRAFDVLRKYEERFKTRLLILKGDNILVEKLPPLEMKTKSGIILADAKTHKMTAHDTATEFGIVLAVGPGQTFEDGTIAECDTKPGEVILLPGNILWYSQFGHLAGYEPYTIGRLRDSQVPLWFKSYQECFDILNTGEIECQKQP